MPLQKHPYLAITSTELDHDVAWMNVVLSPSVAAVSSLPTPPFILCDDLVHAIEPELPGLELSPSIPSCCQTARNVDPPYCLT